MPSTSILSITDLKYSKHAQSLNILGCTITNNFVKELNTLSNIQKILFNRCFFDSSINIEVGNTIKLRLCEIYSLNLTRPDIKEVYLSECTLNSTSGILLKLSKIVYEGNRVSISKDIDLLTLAASSLEIKILPEK